MATDIAGVFWALKGAYIISLLTISVQEISAKMAARWQFS
jgi:hypothetical protein